MEKHQHTTFYIEINMTQYGVRDKFTQTEEFKVGVLCWWEIELDMA